MNRKSDGGGGLDDLMGLAIGLVGALCIWVAGLVGGAGHWVHNPDGELRGFDGGGGQWVGIDEIELDEQVVVLVHGLDEPGGIWDEVAPALFGAGHSVVRFDYPNDQAVVRSAAGMAKAIGELRELGVDWVDIVAHSMGGLVSREAMTNPGMGDSTGEIGGVRIGRLILVGTPNEGSVWARLRGVAEVREHVQRWLASDDMDISILANLGEDGDGQAGVDLIPGSAFLTELNGRAMPASVAVTCIVGRVVDPLQTKGMGPADEAANALGDGVVSVESASLDGCSDVVLLVENHRSLIRTVEIEEGWRAMVGSGTAPRPAGIGIILDRLGRGD